MRSQNPVDPSSSFFVFASAGSGKTKVLVDRFVRLLFEGVDAKSILAITFTKVAIYELKERILSLLERLALDANFCETYLKESLGIAAVTQKDIDVASSLYFKFLDQLHSLNIQTVHSFCQKLLLQFPFEAGLLPNFEVMDETESSELLELAKSEVLKNVFKTNQKLIADLLKYISDSDFNNLVSRLNSAASKVNRFLRHNDSLDDYKAKLHKFFNVQELSELPQELKSSNMSPEEIELKYLTKDGKVRKKLKGKDLEIAHVVMFHVEQRNKIETIDKSISFLTILKNIFDAYKTMKQEHAKLDFADIINTTTDLLSSENGPFVLAKLDKRIEHILIDEAQDMSADQWNIVDIIVEEIIGSAPMKTLFVVGDIKQSIYGFQDASPELFVRFYDKCKNLFENEGKIIGDIYLEKSYRTVPNILEKVDQIFTSMFSKESFCGTEYRKHIAARSDETGIFKVIDLSQSSDQAAEIAKHIVSIADDPNNGVDLKDSMMLIRNRDSFSRALIDELAANNIRVSLNTKQLMRDNLIVKDIITIGAILNDTASDYDVCSLLKSRYVIGADFSERELYEFCSSANGERLRKHLYDTPRCRQFIDSISKIDINDNIFEFLFNIRRTCLINLDLKQEELVAQFLEVVLNNSSKGALDVIAALDYWNRSEISFKGNESTDGLGVSTIHSSKGLEAKSVFFIDFPLAPEKNKLRVIVTDDYFFIKPSEKKMFDEASNMTYHLLDLEGFEQTRLLYVALTRARDNIFLFKLRQHDVF